MMKRYFSRLKNSPWTFSWIWPSLAIGIGLLLRMTFVEDMEYKEDEEYNFNQSQWIGNTLPWPWAGIPSGVYIPNPGMSIWVFAILAKVCRCTTPTQLAQALQVFSVIGIAIILPFVYRFLKTESEKTLWLWAFALSLVNPFLVLYQRKLWPEPFLPVFVMITLMGWWRRSQFFYALLWGMVGAWLGQIHMSGFFYAFALMLWTLCFESPRKTHWKAWFMGSVIGALPLIPWGIDVMTHPVTGRISAGWTEMTQLKYWAFWITDPTGLHLGNPLGLMRGQGLLEQISDFSRYPLIQGQATYLVGVAHAIALICVVFLYGSGCLRLWQRFRSLAFRDFLVLLMGRNSSTDFVLNATLIGCGILMTLTGVVIRRYYMAITFPLEFIFLARLALPSSPGRFQLNARQGTQILAILWVAELLISANFVGYIHVNEGSTMGDYGVAYHKKVPAH